ncbi:MAG: carbon storage regulator [Planctomycetota bacterium]|nr:MAG: carbon storage regulator [Planctomycetota bacterium]
MLVLTRKLGEEIVLPGCNISVTILGIRGRAVRVGITAPADIKVLRRELLSPAQPMNQADQREAGISAINAAAKGSLTTQPSIMPHAVPIPALSLADPPPPQLDARESPRQPR